MSKLPFGHGGDPPNADEIVWERFQQRNSFQPAVIVAERSAVKNEL
jgi:hypothetical protein